MPKVTLDMSTFKALASDTRLDILRALDGKNMSLNEISRITRLNKATLHEHLAKLNEAGLIKRKEREGHKWVYYRLTWKGEGLLHPENTKIVVMFSATFVSLFIAVILLVNFAQPTIAGEAIASGDTIHIYAAEDVGIPLLKKSYNFNYIGSFDATNQTVGDLSAALQSVVQAKNSVGIVYDEEEFNWYTPSDIKIEVDQFILNSGYASRNHEINNSWSKNLDAPPEELAKFFDKDFQDFFKKVYYTPETTDTVGGEYDTNEGLVATLDRGALEYSPAIPEMIATVQDITFLYYAIGCITFFGVAFPVSAWKFLKSRKPIL
jgi:DNA-binding transcriptional ArsR family regulator